MTTRSFMTRALALVTLAALCGCADLRWDRVVYEGLRLSSEQCVIKQRADAAPCAKLPTHDQYERERAALRRNNWKLENNKPPG